MEKINPRDVYGETLVKLGEENPDIVVLDADLSKSTKTCKFGEKFPERFFDMGIAEANMISVAAGLASCGKTAFASTFAVFVPGKVYDQIRMSVAYSNMNVKMFSTHAGVSVGKDGASHQMLEDIALMRVMPNVRVFAPSDPMQTGRIVELMAENYGPMYTRVGREAMYPIYEKDELEDMTIGRSITLKEGEDATIIAHGMMVREALLAHDILKKQGINAEVIDMWTIKPLDKKTITSSAKKTGRIVTVEEHSIIGGLGSAVAETLTENHVNTAFKRMGVNDTFGESGDPSDLLKKYCLTSEDIVENVKKLM
ncbi:MAG TPA: transketolase family protein [Thermoplasmatales archaeon]|nr:transketolase family protein [Thermoplasmatales archaeon]